MKIIVFGPTGGTGRRLIEFALQAGHAVTAFARDPSSIASQPGLKVEAGSVLDAAAVARAVAGQNAVLSALGGRRWRRTPICEPAIRNIAAAMTTHGLKRIVVMSTNGAGDTRANVGWLMRTLVFGLVLSHEVADKEAMERFLESTDLDWTVVRVGLLAGGPARGTFRSADDGSIRGMGKIARADVAAFMLAQVASDTWQRRKPVIVY